ncbi:MAG: lytic transglycosylase [Curvibacter sp. GWA2_64_110]|nr:MAG: lytic transglycosylase [Curvibacter sp. GWA2_64_110]HCY15594.1 lytic transglycosylase [Curvibacter sp.]
MRGTATSHKQSLRAYLCGMAVGLLAFLAVVLIVAAVAPITAHAQSIPREANRYQLTLKREAQYAWGLQAPVASFAAQVHQESRWRLDARSPVGAAGLAQFMPATTDWIGGLYPGLAARDPGNPTWSLRALVTYDKWLADRIRAKDACQDMAFALTAYNGGLGWVYKRQKLSAEPGVCLGVTCLINPGISEAAQRENRHYAETILLKHEPLYRGWGNGSCP